jgi:hypothetical protein
MTATTTRRPHRPRQQDEKERFYLLPGQGGSSYRRKQRLILKLSILVGAAVSLLFAVIMYFICRPPR